LFVALVYNTVACSYVYLLTLHIIILRYIICSVARVTILIVGVQIGHARPQQEIRIVFFHEIHTEKNNLYESSKCDTDHVTYIIGLLGV